MLPVYDLTFPELATLVADWNEPSFRAKQIWHGLYRNFWNTPGEFSNLPTIFRNKLNVTVKFDILTPITVVQSKDGETVKTLFQLYDNQAIESVLMRYRKRNTLCISTQLGCAMGCVFCATGQMGFKRHLSSGEIVAQVMYYARLLQKQNEAVTNVVFMGMGEPLHNYDNTMSAIDRLNDPDGFNFGARRFTISTVGLVPAIRRFAAEKRQVNLAISLHSADNTLRTSMLPVNKPYPIEDLLSACREYASATGRRITFEYALVNEVNDTIDQARLLAERLSGLLCHVNVIPLNPTPGYSGRPATFQNAKLFKETLVKSGIPCTIRMRRGIEIQAGCGQLASRNKY